MLRNGFVSILCLGMLASTGRAQDGLACVQGKWERREKDESGNSLRIVKEHKGDQSTVTAYGEKGEVVYQHKLQFNLRKTDEVSVFTYANLEVTDGPNKGQKAAGPFSYAYRTEGDTFYEVLGILAGDSRVPTVVTWTRVKQQHPVALSDRQVAVLNELRNEVNYIYGYDDGYPRVNLGPCGRFAKAFREQWNARFRHKINIVFVMTPAGDHCHHVLVKLPDGNYFDGGNGVIPGPTLLKQFSPGTRLDEMVEFDLKLLDKWSYGLGRKYPRCPNYSDETTARLIESHLAKLPKNIIKP